MAADSSIVQHLQSGQDQLARIGEAVAAFRRLVPSDYGHFLATIEADLSTHAPALDGGATPLLLAAASTVPSEKPATGSLREAVLGVLADGRQLSTKEIRSELAAVRSVKPATLNTEIFTLRKRGLLRSEGHGRATRHALTARAATSAPARSTPTGKREPTTRAPRRKRDDDEDHPERDGRTRGPDADRIYATEIGDHHLLTKEEELDLARCLEEVEVTIWERLLAGPLAPEARRRLLELERDPPILATASAGEARAADLDRQVASRVIAEGCDRVSRDDRTALRTLEVEADRIRARFATCNLRLVLSVIHRHGYHRSTSLAMSDLIQEGNLGLLKAIPRYDYRRGLRFSTFATWWVRHYLVRARQNLGDDVRVPVHMHDLASKVRRAKVQLRAKLGRDPSQVEIAREIKVSAKSIATLESDWLKYREALPVFDSVGEDREAPSRLASDDVPADEVLARRQEDDRIAVAVAELPPQLALVLRRRFGLDGVDQEETLAQIGRTLRLSRERIRQLEKKALALLRQKLDEIAAVAA